MPEKSQHAWYIRQLPDGRFEYGRKRWRYGYSDTQDDAYAALERWLWWRVWIRYAVGVVLFVGALFWIFEWIWLVASS